DEAVPAPQSPHPPRVHEPGPARRTARAALSGPAVRVRRPHDRGGPLHRTFAHAARLPSHASDLRTDRPRRMVAHALQARMPPPAAIRPRGDRAVTAQHDRFEAELLRGHKGAAVEVPFDPAVRWSLDAV